MLDLPKMYMLNEHDTPSEHSERLEAASSKLVEAFSNWEHWSGDKKQDTVLDFLKVYNLFSSEYAKLIHYNTEEFGRSWSSRPTWYKEDCW